ncbi:MAG: AtpZ/AtpI family protein [Bacteroidota bacterium]
MKKQSENIGKVYAEVGPYLGLGFQLAATIILMFFFGRWLDAQFETEPLWTIVFSFLGGASGIYNFIKTTLSLNKKKNDRTS